MDQYDPYWYSRLISLKACYITIGLFIANLLLSPPTPSLIMIIAGAGILLGETPTINSQDKKDNIYIVYLILMCLTIGVMSSYVYLKEGFIFAFGGWAYFLYSLLKKKPETFTLVSAILMIALVSLEGINTGNYFDILNTLLFILEFAFITFWLHKLFPNIYHKIWLSSVIRSIEEMQLMLRSAKPTTKLFKHIQVANNTLPLLQKKPYKNEAEEINNCLSYYYYYLTNSLNNKKLNDNELLLISYDLQQLSYAVKNLEILSYEVKVAKTSSLEPHYYAYEKLYQLWNQLCVHAKN